jgi:uncharacterized protein (TIGR02246 family)
VTDDERAIRELLARWHEATTAGDTDTVLGLMADDALFLVPGQDPFGKEAFARGSREMSDVKIEGSSDIEELEIAGDWAWMRTRIAVTTTPPDGAPTHRSGHTLTILRRGTDGRWVLARDANLLA